MPKQFLLSIIMLVTVGYLPAQQYGSFKDARDGRLYKTVKIGDQVWMAENLNVDRFRNGDPIPEAKTKEEWINAIKTKQPAWCYLDNKPENGLKFGKLYNWYAVKDQRGIAPEGWHVSLYSDWKQIIDLLSPNAGSKMRSNKGWGSVETGGSKTCPSCENWSESYRKKVPCHRCKDTRKIPAAKVTVSREGNNSSGLSILPNGQRLYSGDFHRGGPSFWSLTVRGVREIEFSHMYNYTPQNFTEDIPYGDLGDNMSFGFGWSVRCIKD